jgi:hypothetical protein
LKIRRFILIIIVLFSGIHGSSQQLGLDVLNGKSRIEIPFSYYQGFIILDVNFQFLLPLKFIFDTGAQNTIIFNKDDISIFQTQYSREISIMGADYSVEVKALIARGVNLTMNNREIMIQRDILVLKEDIVKLREIIGKDIHGILGANIFKGLIVEIDYRRRKLILHDPKQFNERKFRDFEKIPILVNNSKPYLNAKSIINGFAADSLNYLLDTGASISLLHHSGEDTSIQVPENAIVGSLGKGIGGDVQGYVGIIDSFILSNDIVFNQPLSYFQQFDLEYNQDHIFRHAIIGNMLLERFHLVIDYINHVLYLKPNKNFKKAFKYDRSGLSIIASGKNLNTYIVSSVVRGSPADQAGIIPGDIIKRYNWRPKFVISLSQLNSDLSGKVGKKIRLVIERDGQKIIKRFVLRDLFTSDSVQKFKSRFKK